METIENTKETYTYKQLLLSMREELLKVKEKIDFLNNSIISQNKRKYYFFIRQKGDSIPELGVEREIKKNQLYYIKKLLNGFEKHHCTIMLKNNEGMYYPLIYDNINSFNFTIDDTKLEKFNGIVQELLNSDYAHNMFNSIMAHAIDSELQADLYPQSTFLNSFRVETNKAILTLNDNNIFKINSVKLDNKIKTFSQELFNQILNLKFLKKDFSLQYQNIIEKKDYADQKIIFEEEYEPVYSPIFKIEERDKGLVLKNIKK